tara:strand:+ start:798 stop:977 length:180 start_codon:yes stop_codon:yes gene_type:complete
MVSKNYEKKHIMINEIKKINLALKKQRQRTANIEDINFLMIKQKQYGTLNPRIIQNLIK